MKRASYREGVAWIAENDALGDDSVESEVASYISSLLLASLFDVESERVGRDVLRYREKHGIGQ